MENKKIIDDLKEIFTDCGIGDTMSPQILKKTFEGGICRHAYRNYLKNFGFNEMPIDEFYLKVIDYMSGKTKEEIDYLVFGIGEKL